MKKLLILLLLFGATEARALTVESRHPRMFIDPDSVAVIQARYGTGGSGEAIFDAFLTYIGGYYASNESAITYVDDYSMVYLITGDTLYADRAIRNAMIQVRAGAYLSNEGGGPARSSNVIVAYDWCYDRFTKAQRDSILTGVYNKNWDGRDTNYWQPKDSGWHYWLALYGDSDIPAENAYFASRLDASIVHFDDYILPCVDDLRRNGFYDGYAWQKLAYAYMFPYCLEMNTDYSGPGLSSLMLQSSPTYWLHAYRPDYKFHRTPGKYNVQWADPYWGLLRTLIGNTYCQTLGNETAVSPTVSGNYGVLYPLFYNPTLSATPLSGLPLDWYDSEIGVFLSRSGWTMGAASTDILFAFFNPASTEQEGHSAQGHFTISRGADNLLIDSGVFGVDNDDGYQCYYKRTIPHNVVRVTDPAEVYATHTNSYGDVVATPNDGGQNVWDYTCGSSNAWPYCNVGDPAIACRGTMTPHYSSDEYLWIDSDETVAYTAKVDLVKRRMVNIRSGWWVIQDRVDLGKDSLESRITFHMVERPSVDGALTVVRGDSTQGGVFSALTATQSRFENGTSGAVLFAVDDDSASSYFEITGGPSRTGAVWKQSLESEDTYSYVADTLDQSYEFWIDGFNYPPGGRSETFLRTHRNDPGPDVAGDWRLERVFNADDSLRATTAIWVGADTDSSADVLSSVTGDYVASTLMDAADSLVVVSAYASSAVDSLTYTAAGSIASARHYVIGALTEGTYAVVVDAVAIGDVSSVDGSLVFDAPTGTVTLRRQNDAPRRRSRMRWGEW